MNFFKRLFKIGQAEAHSIVDQLENPIKMSEQGIRDLKLSLDKSLKAYAEVKALSIRSNRELANAKRKANDYERKAIMLIEKAQAGEIDTNEADRLASEALARKEETMQQYRLALQNSENLDKQISNLDALIKGLRLKISNYENELKTLKARSKVSLATKQVNKQMSRIDSSGTISMLERMKDKVEKDEALAEAYGEIATGSKTIDEEIDNMLKNSTTGSSALAELKAKLAKKNN